ILERVRIRERETFDSSATPKAGERRVAPKAFADVNLDELRDRMAATIERAKAEDPKELRKTIARLRKELAAAQAQQPQAEREKVESEVPVLANGALDRLDAAVSAMREVAEEIGQDLARVTARPAPTPAPARTAPRPAPAPRREKPAPAP